MEEAVNLSPVAAAIAYYVDDTESCGVYAPKAPTKAQDVWVLQFGRPTGFNFAIFDEALKNANKRVIVVLSCNDNNAAKWLFYLNQQGYPVFEYDDRTFIVAKDA